MIPLRLRSSLEGLVMAVVIDNAAVWVTESESSIVDFDVDVNMVWKIALLRAGLSGQVAGVMALSKAAVNAAVAEEKTLERLGLG